MSPNTTILCRLKPATPRDSLRVRFQKHKLIYTCIFMFLYSEHLWHFRALGIPVLDYTYDDCRLIAQAKQMGIPGGVAVREVSELRTLLGWESLYFALAFYHLPPLSETREGESSVSYGSISLTNSQLSLKSGHNIRRRALNPDGSSW